MNFRSLIAKRGFISSFIIKSNYHINKAPVNSVTNKMSVVIDLRSDTVTVPTKTMREAISTAEVGDDGYGEDPTVKALEEKSAGLLGMEAAMLVPSGTMSNLIAALVHCHGRGTEMITGDLSHMFLYEQGGVAQFGGIHVNTVPNLKDGTFSLQEMKRHVRVREMHEPITSLVCVENTHSKCGGKVLPLSWLQNLVSECEMLKLPLHMDGARLFNASTCLGVPAHEIVQGFASVSVCLSKGLGAPIGSLLHGSKDFIARARRVRKALGGSMRQAGIIAAPGIVAMDSVMLRLSNDHKNALALAKGISELKHPRIKIDVTGMQTNILVFEFDESRINNKEFCQKLLETSDEQKQKLGGQSVCVKAIPFDGDAMRMVLHHQISGDMVNLALKKIALVLEEYVK